jgi:MFS family permease
VGAALVVASGARTVYAINAASFVVSALLLWRIKRSLEDAREPDAAGRFDVRRSLALVRSTAELRIVVVCWSVALLGMGLMEVSQIVLVKRSFGAGSLGYGLTNAALALGLVCGGWRVGAWTAGRSIPHAYGVSILILGGAVAAVGGIPNVWLALPLLAIGGGANAVALSCQRTLVQRSTSDAQRGRAIGIVMAFGNAAFAGSMAAAGPLTSAFGARAVWELSAALFLGASLLVFRMARTVPERRASERPVPLVEGV